MRTDDLDFHLPPELIAQEPSPDRSAARLLHYGRRDGAITHRHFVDLPKLLRPGDLLVFNDARVIPARFMLQKETGGRIEGLYLHTVDSGAWRVLLRNLGAPRPGMRLHFLLAPEIEARVIARFEGGEYELAVFVSSSAVPGGGTEALAATVLSRVGRMPLPPYIKRGKDCDRRDAVDQERYQTVYARQPGSVAAPTAGLHFTDQVLADIQKAGVQCTFVTLHVGLGTFQPITTDCLEDHPMHREAYSITAEAARAINQAAEDGRRIVAVGTTAARVLESQATDRPLEAYDGETGIFIYPSYLWKRVGAMVTNFHLPRTTLISLVAALVGLDEQRRIYQVAIEERYRFFSYGDAMLVE